MYICKDEYISSQCEKGHCCLSCDNVCEKRCCFLTKDGKCIEGDMKEV